MQKTLPAVLTPQEFAQLLQVGIKSARAIMRELPHLNCEQRLNGQYRTLRITREVAEAFLRGELTRLPALPTATSLQMKREYERQLAELGRRYSHDPLPKIKKGGIKDVPHRVSAAHGGEPLAEQAAHPAHGREGHTAKL